MEKNTIVLPDHLFEVSWEVCNKVGGIYTVLSTKAYTITQKLRDKYIVIGPDTNKTDNVDFEEDVNLLKVWKSLLYKDGIRIRTGRWRVKGSPIVVLVDYSSFLGQRDKILAQLWENYKVDSISGGWDYVEPVLFGYAAGKIIENYVRHFCPSHKKIVAHFHEWMTVSGSLYLQHNLPKVATVFTTHATVMGRCIAGNGLHLYSDMKRFNVDELAARFQVVAKHSIEKAGATHCDAFTTVSEITAQECQYMIGKYPDTITPNGFEEEIVWKEPLLTKKREEARTLFIKIAETLLGKRFENDPLLVGTCGRYEFKNKGLDEFIESLAALKENQSLQKEIIAYILVPGWNNGPRHDLQGFLAGNEFNPDPYTIKNVTHYMGDSENDAIINKLRATSLLNNSDGKVSVIFVPAYLNGVDGIFNKSYYELLPAFDLTLFPSYYEPWGYTPLESIAFGVPSVTSSLAGFGQWIYTQPNHEGVTVIERNDKDEASVKLQLSDILLEYANHNKQQALFLKTKSQELASQALWKNLATHYFTAYDKAISMATERFNQIVTDGGEVHEQINFVKQKLTQTAPTWTRIMVNRTLPERLTPLKELSVNLWWSWNNDARRLFESINKELWDDVQRNPIAMIDNLDSTQINILLADNDFLARMDRVYNTFLEYMSKKEERKGEPSIAYFSMEYGIHTSLKIYSGGLGILAGDYLKEASDKNIPMVAVGLLYRYGYFTQHLSGSGEQEATYEAQNFYKLPIAPVRDENGVWKSITLHYPGRDVTALIWRCDVGRTELYLLDTDHGANLQEDKSITHHLYGGDWENRLKQEILLGLGGIKALDQLDVKSDIYHCNEGHAAFIGIKRIQNYIENHGLSFSEALEVVRASSLFTTHTPVPAGHDSFPEAMVRQYLSAIPDTLKITWEQFINLGKSNPCNHEERFSMSFLACNLSQEINGVSMLHGDVSKEILGVMWPGYFKEELHIGYVTNGVHLPSWAASNMQDLYNDYFGPSLSTHNYDSSIWQNIHNVPDNLLWEERIHLKTKLVEYLRRRIFKSKSFYISTPAEIVKISESLNPKTLTIGFARRFATYKRAHLLFSNLERLEKIVNHPERPVQFIFAGKAHPNDKPGQDLIKHIVKVSSMPQFVGKILFIPNYDMHVARRMVQGVDIWLNTPTRPLEASGTSGEKAVMNGVLHFSVLDGWWVEGYKKDCGWMLPQEQSFSDQRMQDELDAETLYAIIEEDITPKYYQKDSNGISSQWLKIIKNSIADVASNFTTKRMIEDYQSRFYSKLHHRKQFMIANNFKEAREIAAWKRRVSKLWDDNLHIVETKTMDISREAIIAGAHYKSEAVISLGQLSSEDIGVEIVTVRNREDSNMEFVEAQEMSLTKVENNIAYYELELSPKMSGSFDIAVRVYAKNSKLPNRMDFGLVKWS